MPVVRLTRGAAQLFSGKSPRAPSSPDDDVHGVVPAVGTSAPSMPPPSYVTFCTKGVRAHSDAPLYHGPEFGNGDQRFQRRYPLLWLKLDNGGTRP